MTSQHHTGSFIVLILALGLAGCAVHKVQHVSGPQANPAVLAFLVDGQTARDTVLAALGEPSRTFERDRILSYRLSRKYEVVSVLTATRFSLILVFDVEGVLARHGLVRVR